MAAGLFSEFAPVSYEEWLAAVRHSLPDQDLARLIKRSYEGFDVHPLAHRRDLADIAHLDSLPGQYPYVRGTRADGYRSQAWLIAQDLGQSDPRRFNQALVHALANGQTAIYADSKLALHRMEDLEIAFADIDLTQFPLLIRAANPAELYGLLSSCLKDDALQQIRGCLGDDPLRTLAQSGDIASDAFDRMAAFVELAGRQSSRLDTIAVGTDVYHEAGANAVQEAALAMATAVVYLREMKRRGLDVELVAGKIGFFMRIGENFFMEIAKFRAVKMMWAQIVDAFGGGETAQKIKLHTSVTSRNKTRHDAYVNMLRVTTEAMAGALGGVDSLQVAPFDVALGESTEFSRRIARNLQLILQEEVRLIDLIDPAGGAWHIEKLTDQLAKLAWRMFQQIEAQGDLIEALQTGTIQAQIAEVAQQRRQDLDEGRTALVGCSQYPNLDETLSDLQNPPPAAMADAAPLPARRLAAPYEELRRRADIYRQQNGHLPRVILIGLGQSEKCRTWANFARELYAPGGFEVIDGGNCDTVESALAAAIDSQAAAVVICAGDGHDAALASEYARALKEQRPELTVLFAADAKNQMRADISVNAYEMNRTLQDKLGIGK